MPYDIKCHKVWQYGYQKKRIDQTNWSMGYWTLRIEKNEAKNAKNWNINFSYVFLGKFLCKKESNREVARVPSIWKSKLSVCSVHQIVSFFHYPFFIFEIFQISPPYDTPYWDMVILNWWKCQYPGHLAINKKT